MMLRQEMESLPTIIGACAHNEVKTPDDECGGRLVHKSIYFQQWELWLWFRVPMWGIFEKL